MCRSIRCAACAEQAAKAKGKTPNLRQWSLLYGPPKLCGGEQADTQTRIRAHSLVFLGVQHNRENHCDSPDISDIRPHSQLRSGQAPLFRQRPRRLAPRNTHSGTARVEGQVPEILEAMVSSPLAFLAKAAYPSFSECRPPTSIDRSICSANEAKQVESKGVRDRTGQRDSVCSPAPSSPPVSSTRESMSTPVGSCTTFSRPPTYVLTVAKLV